MSQWQATIGLEVHVQLNTASKIFSASSTAYGAEPNTQASIIDLGLPGVLPVFNGDALKKAVTFGLAIDASINKHSVFDRKNYFYPDLAKGYQISQFHLPIVSDGAITITLNDGSYKAIEIVRAHLEEDAGKSLHEGLNGMTGLDYNRAGTPLLEVVTGPVMHSAYEAVTYLKTLHGLVRYLEICDGNMQEGSFRCDCNVSVAPVGSDTLGTRAEIKNVNSFRFVEKAIEFEIERQIDLIEDGGTVVQETRLYDADRNETRSMRSKEDNQDYRYFPDPDLLPVVITQEYIDNLKQQLPELPAEKQARFIEEYELTCADAAQLTHDRDVASYFEAVVKQTQAPAKIVANWINGDLNAALHKAHLDFTAQPVSIEQLAQLLDRIADKTISGKIAKQVFEHLWQDSGMPDDIIAAKGLKQVTDSGAIEAIIDEVIAASPNQVEQFKSGKDKVFGYFVGQVMKRSQGKANPEQVNELLRAKLS